MTTGFPLFEQQPERCFFCGEEPLLDVLEVYPETREFEIETCCEGSFHWWVEEMREWEPAEWRRFFAEKAAWEVRSVGGARAEREKDPQWSEHFAWTLDQGITLVPTFPRECTLEHRRAGTCPAGALTLDEIKEYVRQEHAHAGAPPSGGLWGYAVYNGPVGEPVYMGVPGVSAPRGERRPVGLVGWPRTLIGVALVGRPGARRTQESAAKKGEKVVELTRMALNFGLPSFLRHKAASMIYVQAWEDACRAGSSWIQTFTLASESGASLQYARYKRIGTSRGGQADRPSRRRRVRSAELAQPKVKWARKCQ